MKNSYKKRMSNIVKSTNKNVQKALPVVNDGLKTAGIVARGVAKETIPIVEKGVSAVYGTINSGFNLGSAGVKNIGKGIKSLRKQKGGSRRSRRSSRRSRRSSRRSRRSSRRH